MATCGPHIPRPCLSLDSSSPLKRALSIPNPKEATAKKQKKDEEPAKKPKKDEEPVVTVHVIAYDLSKRLELIVDEMHDLIASAEAALTEVDGNWGEKNPFLRKSIDAFGMGLYGQVGDIDPAPKGGRIIFNN